MIYDIAIIGAGPAGLMAAISAAKSDAKIVILEKNNKPGIKLLMTGNGRCNLTNVELGLRDMIKRLGPNGAFLFSAFHRFGPQALIAYFQERGLPTKVEERGKVFPLSDKASDVLTVLLDDLKDSGVLLKLGAKVKDIQVKSGRIEALLLHNDEKIIAKHFIIATGGLSYPTSGSDGDGFSWAEKLGHRIQAPSPGLVPLRFSRPSLSLLEGVSLPDVGLSFLDSKKNLASTRGAIIFSADGLSGPAALDLSNLLPANKEVSLLIDLMPYKREGNLDKFLLEIFSKSSNQMAKHCLVSVLPKRLSAVLIDMAKIDQEKPINMISRAERLSLQRLLKRWEIPLAGSLGFDRAMLTCGGVDLGEVDPKTMRSLIIPNLSFAGEVLDLAGPSGGFNLQIAWSSGFVAGEGAIKSIKKL